MNNINIDCLADFSREEIDVIRKYKTAEDEFAYKLNTFLRGNKVHTPPDHILIQHLDSAIEKCSAVSDLTLYRATCSEDFDRFVNDEIFVDPAYASTSSEESSLGIHFRNPFTKIPIKLIIDISKGKKLLYMETPEDRGESENEFLLPRDCHYTITDELDPIINKNKMAEAMGHNNLLYANNFEKLRIIKIKLLK